MVESYVALFFNFFFAYLTVISVVFFFSSIRRHTRSTRDWSSDVCLFRSGPCADAGGAASPTRGQPGTHRWPARPDRKSTRLNSSHEWISDAGVCLKKKSWKGGDAACQRRFMPRRGAGLTALVG